VFVPRTPKPGKSSLPTSRRLAVGKRDPTSHVSRETLCSLLL
jgi:hypothetical protein